MNSEIQQIIEKAVREAFEAGYNEGYQDAGHDLKHDGFRCESDTAYILIRNTHWSEYQKKLNTPTNPQPKERM